MQRCVHLNDQTTKDPKWCALEVYIAGDALCHQPMGTGHVTAPQLPGPMRSPCPLMVSPNHNTAKEANLLRQDHHLIWHV